MTLETFSPDDPRYCVCIFAGDMVEALRRVNGVQERFGLVKSPNDKGAGV